MKMSLSQMIAIVCILAVGFMMVTTFVPAVDGHNYTFWYHVHDNHCAEWDGTYHTYCGGKRTVQLTGSAPAGHPALNDPNHQAHAQNARPTVYTSSLERVDSCSQCTYS